MAPRRRRMSEWISARSRSRLQGRGRAVALFSLILPVVAAADIVINEIHYDPVEKSHRTEFVELYNAGTATVSLAGWRLSSGVAFAFPSNATMVAGEYLVIAEDPASLSARTGATSIGPFVGFLGNDGERIVLRNSADEAEDEVSYGLGSPWPTASGGEGSSMELIHPALDNDLGGSWRASGYPSVLSPTPGARNSVWATNTPPHVRQVEHSPQQPATTNDIVVSARITDADGVSAATLQYQVVLPGQYLPAWLPLDRSSLMNAPTTGLSPNPAFTNAANWASAAMTDDGLGGDAQAGDGEFSALIPARPANRTLVRYRIVAEDDGGRTVTLPYRDDPSLNYACFVYNGVRAYSVETSVYGVPHTYDAALMNSLPVYHVVTRNSDLMHCYAYSPAYSDWQISKGNLEARRKHNWECAFVYDGEVYDHVMYRLRQNNDRYHQYGKRSMRFRFQRGSFLQARDNYGRRYPTRWRSLNTRKGTRFSGANYYDLSEHLSFALYRLFDVPAAHTHFFHMRVVDGAEEVPAGDDGQYLGDFYGYQLALENHDPRFLEAHGLADGNTYKLRDGVTAGLDIQRVQGRLSVTDASDYDNIRNNLLPARSDAWLREHVDYGRFYSYQAVTEAVRNYDTGYFFVNSVNNKNQVWHFDLASGNAAFGRTTLIPHDTDASWFQAYPGVGGNTQLKEAIYNDGGKPEFKIELRNRIREFRDLVWQREVILPFVEEQAQWLAEFSNADRDRWRGAPAEAGYENSPALSGKLDAIETFAFEMDYEDGSKTIPIVGGRAEWLDRLAADEGDDGVIPETPSITYSGVGDYPVNGLVFSCGSFRDPQGNGTFASMRWRIGEITDTNSPAFDPEDPLRYEVGAAWESEELTTFSAAVTVPPAAVRVGHTYRARVRMKDDTGRWSHWSAPHTFTAGESDHAVDLVNGLRVTEVMYNPPGEESGRDREFVELCNTGTNVLDLSGVRFTAGIEYVFGERDLAPGAYLLLVRDLAAFSSVYPTNGLTLVGEYGGKLADGGERVRLKTALNGAVIADFAYGDGRGWPPAADGAGHSLVPVDPAPAPASLDYGGSWRASTYMGGSPGQVDPAAPHTIVINELAAHTDYSGGLPWQDSDDWIELYNTTPAAFTFDSAWYLSDSSEDLRRWRIPAGSVPATNWITFTEVNDFHPSTNAGFGLDKSGEALFLSHLPGNGFDRVADCTRFKGQENDRTLGRYPDGGAYWFALAPTTNAANAMPGAHVVIDEVMYHPNPDLAELEFVELYNPGPAPVHFLESDSLAWGGSWSNRWRLDGGVSFAFSPGTVLTAGERSVVVGFDPTNSALRDAFLSAYDSSNAIVRMLGPYTGRLSNGGERIALEKPQAPDEQGETESWIIVDEMIYSDSPPWSSVADGEGRTLQRDGVPGAGNNPSSWAAGVAATPGQPPAKIRIASPRDGEEFVVPCTIPVLAEVDRRFVDGGVEQVAFYKGDTLLAAATNAPYGHALALTNYAGPLSFSAVLQDRAGSFTSRYANVTVYTNRPVAQVDSERLFNAAQYDALRLAGELHLNGLPAHLVGTQWSFVSGPGSVWFSAPSAAVTDARFSEPGDYVLQWVTTYGMYAVTNLVSVGVAAGGVPHGVPHEESFEQHDLHTSVVGMRGWQAAWADSGIIVGGSGRSATVPILDDTHEQALRVNGVVTNRFAPPAGTSNVWVDTLLQCRSLGRVSAPPVTEVDQFSAYVRSNGHLAVWHSMGGSDLWTELPGVVVTNGQWLRLTARMDYAALPPVCRLWVDGVAVTNPVGAFELAGTNRAAFSELTFLGTPQIDDLVVDDYDVLRYRKITAVAGPNGAVQPAGEILVPIHGATTVTAAATSYYHVSRLDLDGEMAWSGASASHEYAFTNVLARHTLDAQFGANLTTNGVPEYWFASIDPTWTNDFAALALADPDGDGSLTWEEFVAGTHPTNPADVLVLQIDRVASNGVAVALNWNGVTGRTYRLQVATNVLQGLWSTIHERGGDGGQAVFQHSTGERPRRFYRVRVRR
jgi:hypothetical protein